MNNLEFILYMTLTILLFISFVLYLIYCYIDNKNYYNNKKKGRK